MDHQIMGRSVEIQNVRVGDNGGGRERIRPETGKTRHNRDLRKRPVNVDQSFLNFEKRILVQKQRGPLFYGSGTPPLDGLTIKESLLFCHVLPGMLQDHAI
ncbi:hypothetical protein KIN_15790 [Litoreibacter roseus]|uniref:Uncharacterized protein n=1 Tax=Litoreibacter roseus TaxID=2601869 RepID=A0A6N6JEE8_9RHOB|nr:hypothetical protein KIN_15790 [Litoreibacter roseus]